MEALLLIPAALFVQVFVSIARAALFGGGGPVLALNRFTLDAKGRGKVIDIEGRPGGILGMILSGIGLTGIYSLSATRSEARYHERSWRKQAIHVIPFVSHPSVDIELHRPILALLFAMLWVTAGACLGAATAMRRGGDGVAALAGIGVGLLVAAFYVYLYFAGRHFAIAVKSHTAFYFRFGSNDLAGIQVDFEKAKNAAELLVTLVQAVGAANRISDAPTDAAKPPALPTATGHGAAADDDWDLGIDSADVPPAPISTDEDVEDVGAAPSSTSAELERKADDRFEYLRVESRERRITRKKLRDELSRLANEFPNTSAAKKALELVWKFRDA